MPPTSRFDTDPPGGEDLGARLERCGRLPLDEVVRLGIAVAARLEALHDGGEIHGDLRPEAIRFASAAASAEGDEVADLVPAPSAPRPASEGAGEAPPLELESLRYASPERVLGRALDSRSDLWSLAAVLYRALLGAPPFAGVDREALVVAVTQRSFPSPTSLDPSLPPSVDDFFRRALRKDAVERFPTAAELSESLAKLLAVGRAAVARAAVARAAVEAPARPSVVLEPKPGPEPAPELRWKGEIERALILGAFLLFAGVLAFANRDAIAARLDELLGVGGSPSDQASTTRAPTSDRVAPVRLDGPRGATALPLDTVFIMNVWLERCADCMPSFEAWRDLSAAGEIPDVPVVNVAYGQADPAWAKQYKVSEGLVFDSGERVVRPLGITRFTTLVVAADGKILFTGSPTDQGFSEALRRSVRP